jgi:hypothetical protein
VRFDREDGGESLKHRELDLDTRNREFPIREIMTRSEDWPMVIAKGHIGEGE